MGGGSMTVLKSISVIVPVLAEGDGINRLISCLRALPIPTAGEPEIIVVDGDPRGSTLQALEQDRVKTAVFPPGRAGQMNAGASLATGTILLFLHADTLLPDNAFSLIQDALADGTAVGGAFDLGIDSARWYFRITERYAALRTRVTRVPFGDQAIFIEKAYFGKIGGYRDIPIMEDVELMTRIRKRGDVIRILTAKVKTSPRRWERDGVLLGTLRNLLLQTLYCFGLSPRYLARLYR